MTNVAVQQIGARDGAIPSLQRGILTRPRVEPLLHRAADCAVVLVCAPAGSGKTVLVSNWARQLPPQTSVAWMSCRPTADTPTGFWSATSAALKRAVAPVAPASSPELACVPGAREELLDSLLGWLDQLPDGTVLVCDDFHEIADPNTHRDLQYVIDRLPATFTLIIITRSYPPLAMHRARVEGRLLDIRGSELAFTAQETAELLAINGIELDPDDQLLLQQRTDGWAAGLRLAMISMAHASDSGAVVRRLASSTEAVSGYLTEEVLTRLAPADRTFLLQTCVVDQLTPPLASMLTAGLVDDLTIEGVADRIGFLHRLPESRDGYAYHPLFAELLRRELLHSDPAGHAEQHRRAARWFERAADPMPAIRHAQAAQDWETAARVAVSNVMPLAMRGRIPELSQIVEVFPQEIASTEPRVLLVSALAAAYANDQDRMTRLLSRAESQLPTANDLTARRTRAVAGLAAGIAGRFRGDTEVVLATLTGDGPDVPGPDDTGFQIADLDIWAAWRSSRAAALLWDDQLSAALESARQGCADVRSGAGGWPMVTGLAVMALAAALEGRLTAAQSAVDELAGFVTVRDWAEAPYIALADFAAAWVALERCDLDGVRRNLTRAKHRFLNLSGSFPAAMIDLVGARLTLIAGDGPAAARRILDARAGRPGFAARLPQRLLRQLRLEIALAEGALEAAAELAVGRPDLTAYVEARRGRLNGRAPYLPPDDAGLLLRIQLARAVALHRTGATTAADQVLDQALELTSAEGFRLPIRQLGEPLRQVLIDARLSAARHGRLIADLLSDTAPEPAVSADLVEPLSPRELDVLRHLAAGRDTDEIAGDLFVSRNTVRTHTKNIYRKLDVQSRRDAVLRSAALRLI